MSNNVSIDKALKHTETSLSFTLFNCWKIVIIIFCFDILLNIFYKLHYLVAIYLALSCVIVRYLHFYLFIYLLKRAVWRFWGLSSMASAFFLIQTSARAIK